MTTAKYIFNPANVPDNWNLDKINQANGALIRKLQLIAQSMTECCLDPINDAGHRALYDRLSSMAYEDIFVNFLGRDS